MKNLDILIGQQALAQLAQEKMPVGAGIKVRRLTRQMTEAAGDIEAARKELLETHAKRDADGNTLFIDAEKTQFAVAPEFHVEWQALLALDADVTIDRPLRPGDLAGVSVAPALLMGLGELLEDDV
jgi:hypothetical protein